MAATKADIRQWLKEAKANGASHLIVVCDTYDWEDYPFAVSPQDNVEKAIAHYDGPNMQKVMEVYNLSMFIEPQLDEERAWHL